MQGATQKDIEALLKSRGEDISDLEPVVSKEGTQATSSVPSPKTKSKSLLGSAEQTLLDTATGVDKGVQNLTNFIWKNFSPTAPNDPASKMQFTQFDEPYEKAKQSSPIMSWLGKSVGEAAPLSLASPEALSVYDLAALAKEKGLGAAAQAVSKNVAGNIPAATILAGADDPNADLKTIAIRGAIGAPLGSAIGGGVRTGVEKLLGTKVKNSLIDAMEHQAAFPENPDKMQQLLKIGQEYKVPLTSPEMASNQTQANIQNMNPTPELLTQRQQISKGADFIAQQALDQLGHSQNEQDINQMLFDKIKNDKEVTKADFNKRYSNLNKEAELLSDAMGDEKIPLAAYPNEAHDQMDAIRESFGNHANLKQIANHLNMIEEAAKGEGITPKQFVDAIKSHNALQTAAYKTGNNFLGKQLGDMKRGLEDDFINGMTSITGKGKDNIFTKYDPQRFVDDYRQLRGDYQNNYIKKYFATQPVNVSKILETENPEISGFLDSFYNKVRGGANATRSIDQLHDLIGTNPDLRNLSTLHYLRRAFGDGANTRLSANKLASLYEDLTPEVRAKMFEHAPEAQKTLGDLSLLKTAYGDFFGKQGLKGTGQDYMYKDQDLRTGAQHLLGGLHDAGMGALNFVINKANSLKGENAATVQQQLTNYLNSQSAQKILASSNPKTPRSDVIGLMLNDLSQNPQTHPLLKKAADQGLKSMAINHERRNAVAKILGNVGKTAAFGLGNL